MADKACAASNNTLEVNPIEGKIGGRTVGSSGHKIVVFGASGRTGRFVVAELQRRGIITILAGRDPEKLSKIAETGSEIRVASVDDSASLDRVLMGASLVINCAGPFVDTAAPVIEAALRARIHYLDVTAEQAAAIAAFERFSDGATAAGILILPSMAFYGALGDLLATAAMGDWAAADEISLAVALDNWKPTRGTRLTGERNPGRRFAFTQDRLQFVGNPSPKQLWPFAPPFGPQEVVAFPLAETVIISCHLKTPEVHAYINSLALADLHDSVATGPKATDERDRSAQKFLMEVIVRRGKEQRRAAAAGHDIYASTAPIVAEAVERIITGIDAAGATAPGEIFDAASFLRALSPEHLSFALGSEQQEKL